MLKKWSIALCMGGLLLFTTTSWADELVSFKLGYQLLFPSGTVAGTIEGVGQKVNLEDDLNLDDSEEITAEIALQWGNSRLSVNYLPIRFTGAGTLTVAGEFNGQVFNVDDEVRSGIRIDLYDVGYTYYLINFDDLPTRIQFGAEVAVKITDTELTFEDRTAGFVERESITVPIPTLGLRARIALADYLGLTGRIGYMAYDEHHFLDAEAQVEFSPLPNVGIYAGYRYFDLKIDDEDIFVESEFSGPFAGILVRF
ncbi:MAG: hypothetical protein SV686_13165 [Thermodesulfobacteriota bacterium]|nr:hypothetical protein [Thermodesulfobacteriota bacterium]